MLDFIGIVRQITGIFFAVDKNGDVRQIQAGDKIYAGEKVVGDQFNHSSDYIIITTKNAQYDTKIMGSNEYVFHTQDVQTMLSVYDVPILLEENILDLQQVQQTSQEELIPLELEPDFSHVSTFVPPSSRENEPSHIYEDQSVFIHPTQNEQSTKEYVPLEDRFEVDPRVHIEQPHLNIDPYSSKSADDYIPNDVPTAHDDTISTYEDIANSTIQSSVLNNDDMGMDYNANPIVALKGATKTNNAFSLISEHGTLVLNINGSYTYTLDNEKDEIQALNNDEFLEEIFTYTIEDFNGDQDTATLTIRINANDNDLPTLDVEANSVHEAGLASGSLANGSHITNGTFTFSAIDGLEKVTVNGIDISSNTLSITPLGNQIEITSFDLSLGTASYTYTLLSNETHPLGNADLIDNIEIKVYDTDYDSDVTTQNLAISIVDDVPTAIDDPGLGAHEGGSSFGINLIHNMWGDDIEGADGARILNFTTADGQTANAGETITIATGSLSVNSAGDWVFNPIDTSYDHDNNDPNLANFSYTLIDGDGDTSIGHQNVMLFDSNSKINVNSQTVTESNLANGTNPDNALLSITHNLNIQNNGGILNQNPAIIDPINDVYFTATTLTQLSALNLNALNLPLSYALSNDNHTLKATTADQDIFTLVLNNPNDATGATQSYTFTLHNAIDHTISDPTFQEFNFSITVEDIDSTLASSNSESTTYINVVISDDAPTAVDDPAQTLEEGVEVVSGNVRNNDSFDSDTVLHDFTYTADDSTTQSKTFSDIDTSFTVSTPTGELIIQNNGDWSFTSLA
ncbi:MAG: Ig-like domain-containing protein, partial [Campylobacterota bacterium]|nr:Ig-like domain-containing protein [Campylobacterota bacterium]